LVPLVFVTSDHTNQNVQHYLPLSLRFRSPTSLFLPQFTLIPYNVALHAYKRQANYGLLGAGIGDSTHTALS